MMKRKNRGDIMLSVGFAAWTLFLSSLRCVAVGAPPTPWKYDVEVISSSEYVVVNEQLFCDDDDRLWAKLLLNFGENTDAYHARSRRLVIVSEDGGVTWQITDAPWPGPNDERSVLPDGTIVETASHYWERHPRSEIKALDKMGFYVWDLGEEASYCAILYDMWVRRSTDTGVTWDAFPVHEQFGFFSRFAANSPPHQRLLGDGTIVQFAHGYRPEDKTSRSDLGGTNHPFILRSQDGGRTWTMVQMADGHKSPSPRGFNEIYPVVWSDGRIFAMLRTAAGMQSSCVSSVDGGLTWSEPRATPIFAKHPNSTELADGTLVWSYQRRFAPPFGVRARFTADLGKTWSDEIILRDDVPIADGLVQPKTVELSDGTLFTIFTGTKLTASRGRQSFIGGTRWTRDQRPISDVVERRQRIMKRGSWSPKLPLPPRKPRYNEHEASESPWDVLARSNRAPTSYNIKPVMYLDPATGKESPFFPIGWYHFGPMTKQTLDELHTNGANAAHFGGLGRHDWQHADSKAVLDHAHKLGIKVLLAMAREVVGGVVADKRETHQPILAYVDSYKDHPAILGWQIGDEFGAGAAPAVNATIKLIRDHGARQQIWQVNSHIESNETVRALMAKTDVCTFDGYTYQQDQPPFADVCSTRVLAWQQAKSDLIAAEGWAGNVNVTQAYGAGIHGMRFPTYEEYRWNVFSAIASTGARGTFNWIYCYWQGFYDDNQQPFFDFRDKIVKRVNLEQQMIKHAMETGYDVGTVTSNLDELTSISIPPATGPNRPFNRIGHLLLYDDESHEYFLIVTNNEHVEQDIRLTISDVPVPLAALTAREPHDDRELELKDVGDRRYLLEDRLLNHDIAIYVLPAKPAP